IWISPIVENLVGNSQDGEAYHGYWAQNINALNSNFGTESDLQALSAALHARGMESYFHPFCLIDYSNDTSIKV
ncbi:hypothetical protein DH86_00004064, partial [Scytalidium sp. 3C]